MKYYLLFYSSMCCSIFVALGAMMLLSPLMSILIYQFKRQFGIKNSLRIW